LSKISDHFHELKNWIEGFARKPFAPSILFLLAFTESSIFPAPPDFLLVPLSIIRPRRSVFYAAICVAGSTCGAILGYYIGFGLFEIVGQEILDFFGWTDMFLGVLNKYGSNAWGTILLAGFTAIPFQVFALAAGFKQTVDIETFAFATLIGRSLRFFLVGILCMVFGEKAQVLLGKYPLRIAILLVVLWAVWFIVGWIQ